MPKQTNIFVTPSDIKVGIRQVEAKKLTKYALCGYFDNPNVPILSSLLEDITLGIPSTPKTI